MAAIGAEHFSATATQAGDTARGTAGTSTPTVATMLSTTSAPQSTPPAEMTSPPIQPLTAEFATALTPVLAAAIGPIAAIVAKRALRQAANRADFIALLAAQIDADAARRRFLENAGRL